ncbi:MAG: hypothetical protein V4722_28355 [Bacteroidota bacterium]
MRFFINIFCLGIFCSCFSQPEYVASYSRKQISATSHFIESSTQSLNSLGSVLKKDNYRNKISTLNNPTSSELGFNLELEIQSALKPLLEKAKKTDNSKFQEVVQSLVRSPLKTTGVTGLSQLLPATSIFSSLISLVGSLTISEKKITRTDLDSFIDKIQKYFVQYESLNRINQSYTIEIQKLLRKVDDLKGDLKDFTIDCVTVLHPELTRTLLKQTPLENISAQYYDPQKLGTELDTLTVQLNETGGIPKDALTSIKTIASNIKKLQRDFDVLYSDNYMQIKTALTTLKNAIQNIDQKQLAKTTQELADLYNESKLADVFSLNITLLDERFNLLLKILSVQTAIAGKPGK